MPRPDDSRSTDPFADLLSDDEMVGELDRALAEPAGSRVVEKPKKDWVHRIWPQLPDSKDVARERALAFFNRCFRMAAVTTIAYVITLYLIPGRVDLTGALAALLALQGTVGGSVKNGILRSCATFTGVMMALGFSSLLGLHWYSLFLAVFLGLFLAPAVRLDDQSMEIAISAMLILGTTTSSVAAENRMFSTLIGSAVGVIFPLVFPPRVPLRKAAVNVGEVGRRIEAVYLAAAKQLQTEPLTRAAAQHWVELSRGIAPEIEAAREAIEQVEELRKLNFSNMNYADVVPLLEDGLSSLEDCAFATRALLAVIRRETPASGAPATTNQDLLSAFGFMLEELGMCIGRFGDLIQAQALGDVEQAEERFAAAVKSSGEAQAMLTELALASGGSQEDMLLKGSILSAIDLIRDELNLARKLEEFDEWRASQIGYQLPEGAIGPRMRTPWARAAQRRMRMRAQEFKEKKISTLEDLSDETTQIIPAVKLPKNERK